VHFLAKNAAALGPVARMSAVGELKKCGEAIADAFAKQMTSAAQQQSLTVEKHQWRERLRRGSIGVIAACARSGFYYDAMGPLRAVKLPGIRTDDNDLLSLAHSIRKMAREREPGLATAGMDAEFFRAMDQEIEGLESCIERRMAERLRHREVTGTIPYQIERARLWRRILTASIIAAFSRTNPTLVAVWKQAVRVKGKPGVKRKRRASGK
jgi:hypothetical protein